MNYRIQQSTAPLTCILHTCSVVHPLWALLAVIYSPAMWKEGSLRQNFILCCRVPVGCNLFSTHRYLVFIPSWPKPFLWRTHRWSELGIRVYLCISKQNERRYSYIRVFDSRLFMLALCCIHTVCPASQLIHPLLVSKQGHLEVPWVSVVLLGHSLCNISWRWETVSLKPQTPLKQWRDGLPGN